MEKKELLKKIYIAKEIYDKTVLNKNFLYIYKNSITNKMEYLESSNLASNFLHLTGIETAIKAKEFYKLLNNNRLNLKDIKEREDGWTRVKLDIFPRLPILFNSPIQISLQDNMYTLAFQADLIINKPSLEKEDIILGLKKNKNNDFYVPSSIIKRKPNLLGNHFSRVLFIFSKNITDIKYSTLNYKVNDFLLKDLLIRFKEIESKIDIDF